MSKFTSEIISSLKKSPDSWRWDGGGLVCDDIRIHSFGNGSPIILWITSIIVVTVGSREISAQDFLSVVDCFRLEQAVRRWFRRSSLDQLRKK